MPHNLDLAKRISYEPRAKDLIIASAIFRPTLQNARCSYSFLLVVACPLKMSQSITPIAGEQSKRVVRG